jgi:hypothetical protein
VPTGTGAIELRNHLKVVDYEQGSCYSEAMNREAMNRNVTKSSLEDSIEEARKFGASADEARQIHNLVQATTAPVGAVRNFELKFGPDSANNKAVWVRLVVDNDLNPSDEKITELNQIADKIRSQLLRENLSVWPYVDFRGR